MPWLVGIDEAGYGPNLGPFVMTAVACRVPEALRGAELWDVLKQSVRRHGEPSDARVVVADSKQVYSPAGTLAELERTAHAAAPNRAVHLNDFVDLFCPHNRDEIEREPWFTGTTKLPLEGECGEPLAAPCAALGLQWGPVRSFVVCPAAFNGLIDRHGSKGAVLTWSMVQLLRGIEDFDGEGDDVQVSIDKHGGRNFYTAMLQPAFDDDLVLAVEEGSQRSSYRVSGFGRRFDITFEPRADGRHFCVALASMVSKYLRELFMLEFNRFWQTHVPGVKPTAGYPGDARRFWDEIRPAVQRLDLSDDVLWRRK